MNKLRENLAAEFPKMDIEAWMNQLTRDLKGERIDEKLRHYDDIEDLEYKSHHHWSEEYKHFGPILKNNQSTNNWIVFQSVVEEKPGNANKLALKLLNSGATGIGISSNENLDVTCKDILFEYIHSEFGLNHLMELPQILKRLPSNASVTLNYDPLTSGKTEEIKDVFDACENWNNLRCFQINNHQFAAAGCNATQQLGILLSQVNAYFKVLMSRGLTVDQIANSLEVNLGIGSQFFIEIAKFRALKILFKHLLKTYGVAPDFEIRIKASSIMLNKSLQDPHTNLLRLTTEGISAVIGGVDILELQPYDLWSEKGPSEFAYRMSTNISNLLVEESYLNVVQDSAYGAFSIANLTKTLSEKGYALFQEIERSGGYNACLFTGFIENEIYKTAEIRKRRVLEKKDVLVGINKFENPNHEDAKWQIPNAMFSPLVLENEFKSVAL